MNRFHYCLVEEMRLYYSRLWKQKLKNLTSSQGLLGCDAMTDVSKKSLHTIFHSV